MESNFKIDKRSLANTVAARLRQEIVTGVRKPGARLSQDALAIEFDVSRIPIREALQLLANEGLVTLKPHHGARVSELNSDDFMEMVGIARSLEVLATQRGAARITKPQLNEMQDLIQRMEKMEDQTMEWYALNREFHMVLVNASGWNLLTNLVREYRHNLMRYVVQPEMHIPTVKTWHRQHQGIYEACASGNVELAVARMTEHLTLPAEISFRPDTSDHLPA